MRFMMACNRRLRALSCRSSQARSRPGPNPVLFRSMIPEPELCLSLKVSPELGSPPRRSAAKVTACRAPEVSDCQSSARRGGTEEEADEAAAACN
mmetsp:Transcript_120115/g.169058  ORF Transcript_120115/g.169058 Transcript_120115/m.169058 type:complete len:95 (+) Transcript_120115:123-407(+)